MKTPKTYADKVNELLAKQTGEASDESSEEAEAPRVTEFLDDEYELPQAQSTEFRKRNVKLLSEQSAKYKGKVASRNELETEESDSEEAASETDNDMEDFKTFGNKLKKMSNDNDENVDDDDDKEQTEEELDQDDESNSSELGEEEDDVDEFDESELEEDLESEDHQIVCESNRQKEIQKGACVQNQLRIWEKLLEMRIQSQKILTKANQLPAPEDLQAITNVDALKTETVENVNTLLSKLWDLKTALSQQYPELSKEVKAGHKRHSQARDSVETPSKRFAIELAQNFESFRSYRNNVLLKWDDRTKVMTPGAGKRKSAQEDYDILKKITHALNNRQSLIQRSQTIKSNSIQAMPEIENETVKVLTHIYDDSDFYHQQLRELIEYKANTTSNMAEVTKQYVELQKLRQKMKKKVDTRASKGRKIRYMVHNKLVNFMAPEDTSTWTEESKDELYKSLFVA